MDDKRGEESKVAKWKQRKDKHCDTILVVAYSNLYNNQKY